MVEVLTLTDSERAYLWEGRDGCLWRWEFRDSDGAHGWQYSEFGERWRWHGLGLEKYGPYCRVETILPCDLD